MTVYAIYGYMSGIDSVSALSIHDDTAAAKAHVEAQFAAGNCTHAMLVDSPDPLPNYSMVEWTGVSEAFVLGAWVAGGAEPAGWVEFRGV
jgi:hypothetical protein